MHHDDENFVTSKAGVLIPRVAVAHKDDEYDPSGFDTLREMQDRHFWYQGRHRFLLSSLARALRTLDRNRRAALSAIDLGAGCGGWLAYLHTRRPELFAELALGDSSVHALEYAGGFVGPDTKRYQVDLLQLPWRDRWDVAFLLDVLEHIPQQEDALRQIRDALVPGGMLFVTVPALDIFWTWNDEVAHHQRRYRRADFRRLAAACGLELVDVRYFMFFLSPLLLASRVATSRKLKALPRERWRELSAKMHKVPSRHVNGVLAAVFGSETPLGHYVPFPWGTSLLAVLRRPLDA